MTVAAAVGAFAGANAIASAAPMRHSATTSVRTSTRTPHVEATVTSVNANGITVTLPDGSTTTYATDANTTYTLDHTASTASAVTTGSHVDVAVSSTTAGLATTVGVETTEGPGPAGGPGVPGDRHGAPMILGTVVSVSVSDSTIVVADRDGFYRTIVTNSSTTYSNNGASADRSAVVTGATIAAIGSVDANHTSLDATQVAVGQPSESGRFGFGHGGFDR